MERTYVNLEQIAAMTGLSERTIRGYLSMGVLQGEKADGAWRVTEQQFEAFLEQDMVRQSLKAKTAGIIRDFLLQTGKPSPAACAVLEYPADAAWNARLRAVIAEADSLLGEGQYRLQYRKERGYSRLTVTAVPAGLRRLLERLEAD